MNELKRNESIFLALLTVLFDVLSSSFANPFLCFDLSMLIAVP